MADSNQKLLSLADMRALDFQFKVCGMEVSLAQELRKTLKKDDDSIASWAGEIQAKFLDTIHSNVSNDLSVGIALGGSMRSKFVQVDTDGDDVIIFLLTDPTDIDSKQITFIRNTLTREQETAILNATYKFNPNAT